MSDELKVTIEAAKRGANYANTFFGKEILFSKKSDNTIFTKVDEATEKIIKNTILIKFPDAKFVGEETGGVPNNGKFWTIDPIDGTRYFARDIPLWSTLISLVVNGKPVIGVSNAPALKELIYAEKGNGTFLNEKKVVVSNISEINNSLLMLGSLRFFKEKITIPLKLMNATDSTRSIVSPYALHLLSSGRCEIFFDIYGKIWDISPFKVIVEEAGGKMTNWKGKDWTINDRGCVATNRLLHNKVIEIINNSA
jgi:histidinol-phosphatase